MTYDCSKVIIHRADIPLAMQNAAVAAADVAMDKHGIEKVHIVR
jgi:hypothetical protein